MPDVASITTYDTLLIAAAEYIARNDLDEYFQVFVQLTEKRLNSALKVPGMEVLTSVAINDTTKMAPVPAEYVEWISAEWTGTGTGARTRQLRYVEPNSPEFTFRFRPNGSPQYYTILAGGVRTKPYATGSIALAYYRQIPPLGPSAQSNWLIAKAPQLYLYGVLGEAYSFQKDEAKAGEWLGKADERLKLFIAESSTGKVGRRAERVAEMEAEIAAAKALN